METVFTIFLSVCLLDFLFLLFLVFRKRPSHSVSHEDDWELDERAAREKLPESPW